MTFLKEPAAKILHFDRRYLAGVLILRKMLEF